MDTLFNTATNLNNHDLVIIKRPGGSGMTRQIQELINAKPERIILISNKRSHNAYGDK